MGVCWGAKGKQWVSKGAGGRQLVSGGTGNNCDDPGSIPGSFMHSCFHRHQGS